MDGSFTQWRDSPRNKISNSVVISDSEDDDVVENSEKDLVYVIESSDGSENCSRNLTPRKLQRSPIGRSSLTESAIRQRIKNYIPVDSDEEPEPNNDSASFNDYSASFTDEESSDEERTSKTSLSRVKTSKRKDVSHDNTREGTKGLRLDSPDEFEGNFNDDASTEEHGSDIQEYTFTGENDPEDTKPVVDDGTKETNAETEVAISFAKKEIGVGNIDPLVAQKRALLVCKLQQLENQLNKTKLLYTSGNIDLLPDKGEKLRENIIMQERQIEEITAELENTPLTHPTPAKTYPAIKAESPFFKREFTEEESFSNKLDSSYYDPHNIPTKPKLSPNDKELGKQAQATLDKELALTVDRLQDLHGSLVARPSEDERAEDPKGLKVKLMEHQQHALAWLLWREQQRPPGGVLADDMGLGKTLTMISLIMASMAKENSDETSDNSDDEWSNRSAPLRHKGGTLVVCPASLLAQWESEIKNRCKRGMLSVEVYHGTNRENVPKRLAKNDVVITTYNILTREFKRQSTVYKIHWKRAILDEAHVVRNHKSQASEAVCGLLASKRWALTGTPIQNKEMDLYSILKFLKCSPFDDIRVWKRWVDNKNAAGRQRLATVMKTLMLRRTKKELQAKGALDSLPEKCIEEISVKLDSQEQLVYEKVLIYSRTLFAQFLAQRAEKDHMVDLGVGKFDAPSYLSNPNKNTQFTKAQNKLLSMHADVKTHEILVLLLRLRQICCHPSLIHAMLDQEDMKESGIMDSENLDPDLLSQVNNITLHESGGDNNVEREIGIDHRVTGNLLTSKNPVFEEKRKSSKMKAVLAMVEEILQKNDKLIIVSQWTSMLEIVASHLSSIKGATYSKFTGNVPIKDRQGIMDSFNAPNRDPKILLLSLTAGGVGLNLVGGNHLLLIDIHWNPQLETQAQDRIYRFGQTKDVFIYKFICKDTIEERIKHLQERKLDIAQNVLSGDNSAVSKLTLNDLKSLFAL